MKFSSRSKLGSGTDSTQVTVVSLMAFTLSVVQNSFEETTVGAGEEPGKVRVRSSSRCSSLAVGSLSNMGTTLGLGEASGRSMA